MNEMAVVQPSLTEAMSLSTGPVPTSLYTDPARYEVERERIFGRAWLKVGRVEQIAEPGDFFRKDIAVLDASVVVSRTKDGRVRAFHNTCSHRGNQVVLADSGKANRFVCRYHSWTYKNTGDLVGVPDEAGFFDLDKKACGLAPVACDVWEGWIFINLQSKPEVSLASFLGSFGEVMTGIPYPHPEGGLVFRGEFEANWKAVADAFAEVYHLPSIHPKTFAPTYAGPDNPFCKPLSATAYGPHRNMSVWGNISYEPAEASKIERWVFGRA